MRSDDYLLKIVIAFSKLRPAPIFASEPPPSGSALIYWGSRPSALGLFDFCANLVPKTWLLLRANSLREPGVQNCPENDTNAFTAARNRVYTVILGAKCSLWRGVSHRGDLQELKRSVTCIDHFGKCSYSVLFGVLQGYPFYFTHGRFSAQYLFIVNLSSLRTVLGLGYF